MKANYKHTRIFKIFNPADPNKIYLSVSAIKSMTPEQILRTKYKSNETNERGYPEFFKNKKLKCEYLDEMGLGTQAEIRPHLFLFCERLDNKYTVINPPNLNLC